MRVCIKPLLQINSRNLEAEYALFAHCFSSFAFATQVHNRQSRIPVKSYYYYSPIKKKETECNMSAQQIRLTLNHKKTKRKPFKK